jgi:hypothetical protein
MDICPLSWVCQEGRIWVKVLGTCYPQPMYKGSVRTRDQVVSTPAPIPSGLERQSVNAGWLVSCSDPGLRHQILMFWKLLEICQHARAVAVFTAPHEESAAAHLCRALNSLQRYIRAARAGRDRCIPHCVRNRDRCSPHCVRSKIRVSCNRHAPAIKIDAFPNVDAFKTTRCQSWHASSSKAKGSGEFREGTSSFTVFIAKENASWARSTHSDPGLCASNQPLTLRHRPMAHMRALLKQAKGNGYKP